MMNQSEKDRIERACRTLEQTVFTPEFLYEILEGAEITEEAICAKVSEAIYLVCATARLCLEMQDKIAAQNETIFNLVGTLQDLSKRCGYDADLNYWQL